jgi:hypothetical protein
LIATATCGALSVSDGFEQLRQILLPLTVATSRFACKIVEAVEGDCLLDGSTDGASTKVEPARVIGLVSAAASSETLDSAPSLLPPPVYFVELVRNQIVDVADDLAEVSADELALYYASSSDDGT